MHYRLLGRTGLFVSDICLGIRIPWLRFGLKAQTGVEVYQWTLDTASRPLRPGEMTNFVTRVAAPPESAKIVEIRFAHANEIGSNAAP